MEIVRFPVVSHIILNACAKSTVESMAKGIVAIANLRGILIELDHILLGLDSGITSKCKLRTVSRSDNHSKCGGA